MVNCCDENLMQMEDLRITRLVLNHVGVFEHLDLSFVKKQLTDKAEIHIFTGENGSGKTTLLEALTYFDVYDDKTLGRISENGNNIDDKLDHENLDKSEFAIEIDFSGTELKFFGPNGNVTGGQLFMAQFHNRKIFPHFNHPYNFFLFSGTRQMVYEKVDAYKNISFDPMLEALSFNKKQASGNLFQWIMNNKTRSAFLFQKGDIKKSQEQGVAITKIEKAISDIINKKIKFVIDEESLSVMVNLDDSQINYNTLAEGYKSVISWISDLMFRLDCLPNGLLEHFTLFLDEIDVHLHPSAQRRILPVIQKLFPNAQIFLTTHSPFVIGSVDDAWVYKFKLNENGNSVLAREPFLSEDANSYQYILEDVFDIQKQFGIEVEEKLDEFYKTREAALNHPDSVNLGKIKQQAVFLARQSIELQSIIGSELKQLSRILKTEISL